MTLVARTISLDFAGVWLTPSSKRAECLVFALVCVPKKDRVGRQGILF